VREAYQFRLTGEPRKRLDLIDVHRSTENEDGIVTAEFRQRARKTEVRRVPRDGACAHEIFEISGILARQMLQHQKVKCGLHAAAQRIADTSSIETGRGYLQGADA